MSENQIKRIEEMLKTGISITAISKDLKINRPIIYKIFFDLAYRTKERQPQRCMISPVKTAYFDNEDMIGVNPTYSSANLTGWELETYLNLENGINRKM